MKTLLFLSTFLFSLFSLAQTGTVRGQIIDKDSGAPLEFTKVLLYQDSTLVTGAVSDLDGLFTISKVAPGTYRLETQNMGYTKHEEMVQVEPGTITQVRIEVSTDVPVLEEIVIHSPQRLSRNEVQCVSIQKVSGVMSTRSARSSRRYSKASQAFNTEEYGHFKDNDFKSVTANPLSTFSIDVDRAAYANVRRMLNEGTMPPEDAVRIEEMINYFTYEYPEPQGEDPFSVSTEFTECPWNPEHRLIHIGIHGKEIRMDQAAANNLVFLIDVSGSMSSPDKLDLLKSGLYLLVDQLRANDRVAIVVYAGAAGLVLPSTSGDQKDQIKSVIEQLDAGGSTAGGEGIELAYKVAREQFKEDGNNRVILATDGDFNVGVSSDGELIRLIEDKRKSGIFLSVLGFGTGNLKDHKMEQLADKGNGNYNYIDNLLEARKVLVKELGGTLVTIAKDVKIQAEFNPQHVKGYRLIGYVNRQLADEDFNDDTKDAGELGSGHTVTALYEIVPAGADEEIPGIDSLRYQKTKSTDTRFDNELMTLKLRYKQPRGISSKLIVQSIPTTAMNFGSASENCRFAASVAAFGMLLRDSKYKGNSDYTQIVDWAKNAKGSDDDGYRAEFVRLVELAAALDH